MSLCCMVSAGKKYISEFFRNNELKKKILKFWPSGNVKTWSNLYEKYEELEHQPFFKLLCIVCWQN